MAGAGLPAAVAHPIAVEAAAASPRIAKLVYETPLLESYWLGGLAGGGASVHLKLESEQVTGSFKARGAANKVLSLSDEEASKGVITASTGNHGLGFLHAAGARPGLQATIYVPRSAAGAKIDKLKAMGANLVFHGNDCVETEREARSQAEAQGACWVSPYNDVQIAGGQGTMGLEILDKLPDLDAIFVPVGGGGLISGIAAVVKAARADIEVVGCSPAASNVMQQSVEAGHVVDVPSYDTLSDGTAGGVEEDTVTFQPCVDFVDSWVTATEPEIETALVELLHYHSKLVEGAAAMTIACFKKSAERFAGKRVAVVCCGGNISPGTLTHVLSNCH